MKYILIFPFDSCGLVDHKKKQWILEGMITWNIWITTCTK